MRRLLGLEKKFLLRSDIWDEFRDFCEIAGEKPLLDSPMADMLRRTQEALVDEPWLYFAVRPKVAAWKYYRLHVEVMSFEEISTQEFLGHKERYVNGQEVSENWVLELDLTPFERDFPKLKEIRSIGRGVDFLNKHLSSRLFDELGKGDQKLLDFLRVHKYNGMQLMVNNRIESVSQLRRALNDAEEYLTENNDKAQWDEVCVELQTLGFEPGWGRTAVQMRNNLTILSDILEAPDPRNLAHFLGHIPMVFNIVILSPHGYFGQEGVLGLPDTGGQVVYILDQVRALEKELRARLYEQGLDISPHILVVTRLIPKADGTTCNQPLEKIIGTENTQILRVPFRKPDGEVVLNWISRFKIWPYLERFALDVETEILAQLRQRPDLIIGNYSDGNLVAYLLSQRLGVTQCNIAHALEKTKYLYSALFWKDNEPQYHFSNQFTADLIAMNSADFIIASTYQEIAGTGEEAGQYESYQSFTMPKLFRVLNGVDIFDPKFNIVSPGSDAEVYFPYHESKKRFHGLHEEITELIFGEAACPDARGVFTDKKKPLLFAMARLDQIKNIAGLVQWYGQCPRLQKQVNLLVIAGYINSSLSTDEEEKRQIHTMHQLMDSLQLDDKVRWLGIRLPKNLAGEIYRCVADSHGAFVQPALFEAFGLTVIEAMASGLPTFATRYGGPMEIIENTVSGFHIDPNHGEQTAEMIADFFEQCETNPEVWESISANGIKRVESRYTWKLYANRLISLACIYGFWKYSTNMERQETRRYLEMFYALKYRKLASTVPI